MVRVLAYVPKGLGFNSLSRFAPCPPPSPVGKVTIRSLSLPPSLPSPLPAPSPLSHFHSLWKSNGGKNNPQDRIKILNHQSPHLDLSGATSSWAVGEKILWCWLVYIVGSFPYCKCSIQHSYVCLVSYHSLICFLDSEMLLLSPLLSFLVCLSFRKSFIIVLVWFCLLYLFI